MRKIYSHVHDLLQYLKRDVLFFISLVCFGCFPGTAMTQGTYWQNVPTGTTASLRGIAAVSDSICWVSGSQGVVCRTTDGGRNWRQIPVLPGDSLDFRDIEAFGNGKAVLMSAGLGNASRIFVLEDGGRSWREVLVNEAPGGFFNGMDFWDKKRGILAGDPIDGRLFLLKTADGGETWQRIPPENIPMLKEEEYGFAASGSHITTQGKNRVWIGTGGKMSRVFFSEDAGETWSVSETPIIQGASSTGIFSLDFRSKKQGIAVGGDYTKESMIQKTIIRTQDSGQKWALIKNQNVPYVSSVRFLDRKVVAVGPAGSFISQNQGKTWQQFSETGFHAVDTPPKHHTCWASGTAGRVGRLILAVE